MRWLVKGDRHTRSDIIPPNRLLTAALTLGLIALIIYGAVNRDPATIVIVVVVALFFGLPALVLANLRRRGQRRGDSDPHHSRLDGDPRSH